MSARGAHRGRTRARRRPGRSPASTAGAIAAAAAAAVGLAACSSNPTTPADTGTTATTAPATTSTTATSTTTSPVGAVACTARDLAITVAGTQGAAGTLELTFGLRNTSAASCPMEGFPGAQLLAATGTQLPTHVVQGGSYSFTNFAPSPVNLEPGATAYFNLGYSDVPSGNGGQCPTAAQIQVFPPHASDDDVVSGQQLIVCDGGTLTVSPVFVAGSGSETTAPQQP